MVKYYDTIPRSLFKWIDEQKVFWIATAPLSEDGLINLSPKGVDGTFHVVDESRVWYEDLTGSGVATIAHVRENGRITVLFNAFEGPPRILRLYGKASVYEFGTPEYEQLLPSDKRTCGSRSIIMIDVFKVATSCGFGVPFYTYREPRNKLLAVSKMFEQGDVDKSVEVPVPNDGSLDESETSILKKGLKNYWRTQNVYSLDGLPALEGSFDSEATFCLPKGDFPPDDERVGSRLPRVASEAVKEQKLAGGVEESDVKVVLAFLAGAFVATSYLKFLRNVL